MLPGLTLPASWRVLLETFRPAFRRSSTFGLFELLATGLVARTARRTVVGMLAGAGMAAVVSFHAVCRFFSTHAWDADRLGLALARLIVTRLLDADAPIEVVVDDTLFRRWGRGCSASFWTHDGSAQDPNALGRGNRWVIVGIVVELPFCSHPVCLPVLFRLWRGKGTPSPVRLAGQLITLLAKEFPEHTIHPVGDAAYHGKALLTEGTTFTTRLPANAVLYAPPPPRTGKRGRPRLKGHRLGTPAELATTADWRRVTVTRYGRRDTVDAAETAALWYGAFGNQPGRVVLVRDPGSDKILATLHHRPPQRRSNASWPATRTAGRSRPPSPPASNCSASAKPATACSRAVERTVPFEFIVYSLVIVWYALHGHHPDDLDPDATAQPWYRHKDDIAFEDMLAKLRRTLVAARITGVAAAQPDPNKYRDYELACAAAAA